MTRLEFEDKQEEAQIIQQQKTTEIKKDKKTSNTSR
jgi:hypothetical protein